MRGAWSALLAALVAAVAATVHEPEEPEARDALADLKAKILAGLGMEKPPDLSNVSISAEHMQRMTRRYFRTLRQTEQELLTYHQTGKTFFFIYCYTLSLHNFFQLAQARKMYLIRLTNISRCTIKILNK